MKIHPRAIKRGGMNFFSNPPAEPLAAKLIEERYKAEEELLAAIAQGNMEKALKVHGRFRNFHIAKRYKDPARNFRNLMITANTLYRKAAQAGCVHPVHIDISPDCARWPRRIWKAYGLWSHLARPASTGTGCVSGPTRLPGRWERRSPCVPAGVLCRHPGHGGSVLLARILPVLLRCAASAVSL